MIDVTKVKMDTVKIKKGIRYCDIMVTIAIFLMLSTRIITVLYLMSISSVSGQDIKDVAVSYEANPVVRWFISLKNVGMMLNLLVIPAFIIALYIMFKRSVLHHRWSIENLTFFANFMVILFAMNIINDLTVLIGGML